MAFQRSLFVITFLVLLAYAGYSWYVTTRYDKLRDRVDTMCVIFDDAIPIFANDTAIANKQTAELIKIYRRNLCQT